MGERRQTSERRKSLRGGGRRHLDMPTPGQAWTVNQLAYHLQLSRDFIIAEIKDRDLIASKFGSEYRIASAEVRRYLAAKGFPAPDTLAP